MRWHWLSTTRMTVGVGVDDRNIIRTTPPIVWKFRGQHINNLKRWLKRQPGYKHKEIS